jgi:hypothetical protein
MKIISHSINFQELKTAATDLFGDMVKAVVDVEQKLLAVDAELHSDLEALLLQNGSRQEHLWGINLYPDLSESDWLEYDSLINIRPSQNNQGRGVEDPGLRQRIRDIITEKVKR